MSDLISRQEAIDTAINLFDSAKAVMIRICKALPSTQPEIIRCKDCDFYDGRPCGIVDWYNTADDFCSKAERKNNG